MTAQGIPVRPENHAMVERAAEFAFRESRELRGALAEQRGTTAELRIRMTLARGLLAGWTAHTGQYGSSHKLTVDQVERLLGLLDVDRTYGEAMGGYALKREVERNRPEGPELHLGQVADRIVGGDGPLREPVGEDVASVSTERSELPASIASSDPAEVLPEVDGAAA